MGSETKKPLSCLGCLLMLGIVTIPFGIFAAIVWGLLNIGWEDVSHLSHEQKVTVVNVYGTGHQNDGTYQIIFTYSVNGVNYFGWAQDSISSQSTTPQIPTLCINPDKPEEYVEQREHMCGEAREARIIKAKTSSPSEES